MEFTIEHAALARGVATVTRAVPTRTTLPVLTGLLVEANGSGQVRLLATDLDVTVDVGLPAQVKLPGRAVVPARLLGDILRRIPSGAISWATDAGHAVTSLRWLLSEWKLHGFSPDQFPDLPAPSEEVTWTSFDSATLRQTLWHTVFACAGQAGGRPILTGVELALEQGKYRAIATDGMRVTYFRSDVAHTWCQPEVMVVPAAGVAELVRALGDGDGDGRLCRQEGQLYVEVGGVRLAMRLLEGRYPAILDLIPKAWPTTVTVDCSALRDACERVALVTDVPDRLYAVLLHAAGDRVEVTASSPEAGEARESVAASVDGQEVKLAVNAKLLVEGLRRLGDGEVLIDLSGPQSLARYRLAQDERAQYMQMPVRIG